MVVYLYCSNYHHKFYTQTSSKSLFKKSMSYLLHPSSPSFPYNNHFKHFLSKIIYPT